MVEMKLNTKQDVLLQVEQICDAPEGDLRAWLHKETLLNALKFKRDFWEFSDQDGIQTRDRTSLSLP